MPGAMSDRLLPFIGSPYTTDHCRSGCFYRSSGDLHAMKWLRASTLPTNSRARFSRSNILSLSLPLKLAARRSASRKNCSMRFDSAQPSRQGRGSYFKISKSRFGFKNTFKNAVIPNYRCLAPITPITRS